MNVSDREYYYLIYHMDLILSPRDSQMSCADHVTYVPTPLDKCVEMKQCIACEIVVFVGMAYNK